MAACAASGFSQTQVVCGAALDAPLRSRGSLTIESRPAGLEIVGTDHDAIHVTCSNDDKDSERQVQIRFSGTGGDGKLTITSGTLHTNNLKIRVEVPHRTSIRVRMGAGQVTIDEVAGDKDVELTAGQISLRGLQTRDYRRVDASVDVGQVSAPAYGTDKGGFFRSFTKKTPDGEYVLHAHVTTGQIELQGSGSTAE